MTNEFIKVINKEYGTNLTGVSPKFGGKGILNNVKRLIVKDFGNGLGRVLYVDKQNRLVANNMENI